MARTENVLVAAVVTVGVIDGLEVVDIDHDDGEFRFSFVYGILQIFFHFFVGDFAVDVRQCILECENRHAGGFLLRCTGIFFRR